MIDPLLLVFGRPADPVHEFHRFISLRRVVGPNADRVDFEVIDKKTGEDITRQILLQVISEQESHGDAIMSEDFLSEVIRAYGAVVPDYMGKYLEQSMNFFMQQQKFLQGQMQSVVGNDPISAMAELTQKNIARFQSFQEEMLKGFMGESNEPGDDSPGGQKKAG